MRSRLGDAGEVELGVRLHDKRGETVELVELLLRELDSEFRCAGFQNIERQQWHRNILHHMAPVLASPAGRCRLAGRMTLRREDKESPRGLEVIVLFYSKTSRRFALMALLLAVLGSSCVAGGAPKSIILLIGDGMGIGHITAARCAGPGRDGRLAIDTMPFTGLAITHSANALVTDSAAAGTALATGAKTNNGTISQTPDGKRVASILELARDMGKSTGIVSTDSITGATPAVFVAHVTNRGRSQEIADQIVASRVDVVLGGGKGDFVPKTAGGKALGRAEPAGRGEEAGL